MKIYKQKKNAFPNQILSFFIILLTESQQIVSILLLEHSLSLSPLLYCFFPFNYSWFQFFFFFLSYRYSKTDTLTM